MDLLCCALAGIALLFIRHDVKIYKDYAHKRLTSVIDDLYWLKQDLHIKNFNFY